MTRAREARPEFSRPFALATLGDFEVVEAIEAQPDERGALAKRFELLSLDGLRATLRVSRARAGNLIRITGRLDAEVTQACVVTLEPVSRDVSETFTLIFDSRPQPAEEEREITVDMAEESAEPLPPGGIDLGEIAAEQLALVLDPYPRSEGVMLERSGWGAETSAQEHRPLAGLGALMEPEE